MFIRRYGGWLVCGLIVALIGCWPLDVPWGGDDVVLVSTAIRANRAHRLITAGLGGSFGYPYGPIPSQIYQCLALVSVHPPVLAWLHAVLLAGTTALALLYLARVLRLNPWYAALTLLGPFFWFYSRVMWDNPFAIPVGTLLIAAYGDYLQHACRKPFLTAAACAGVLPLIHPMTLPLVIPVVLHAVLLHRDGFKKHWPGLLVIALCIAVCSGTYAKRVAQQMSHSSAFIPPRADVLSWAGGLAFPFLSGRLFSAHGFFDHRGPERGWESLPVMSMVRWITIIAYPLIWWGMILALVKIGLAVKSSARVDFKRWEIDAICLEAMLLQAMMDSRLRISPYPHYYTGTWVAAVIFLWLGLDWLKKLNLRLPVATTYAITLALSTLAFALDIHRDGGGQVWYGPSLGAQLHSKSAQAAFTGE